MYPLSSEPVTDNIRIRSGSRYLYIKDDINVMKRIKNIRRIDNEAKATYAWLVQVQRGEKTTIKMFSDGVYGGKRKALQAAIEYRDLFLSSVDHFKYRMWLRTILRSNNSSGIPGVARYVSVDQKTGNTWAFWLASWIDEHGISRKRKFSVLRYGERKAKKLAMTEREEKLKEICSSQVA